MRLCEFTLYHPYLVCILFGMPSVHSFTSSYIYCASAPSLRESTDSLILSHLTFEFPNGVGFLPIAHQHWHSQLSASDLCKSCCGSSDTMSNHYPEHSNRDLISVLLYQNSSNLHLRAQNKK